jgi:hypothetical protein
VVEAERNQRKAFSFLDLQKMQGKEGKGKTLVWARVAMICVWDDGWIVGGWMDSGWMDG